MAECPAPSCASVWEALEQSARAHANRPALTYAESAGPAYPARSWTYAGLLARVRQAANLFRHAAGHETPRVAMLLPNIPQAWFTLLGAETAGMVCPVNYLLRPGSIAELVQATGANILVALGPDPQLDIWPKADAVRAACPGLKRIFSVGPAPGAEDFDTALDGMPHARLEFDPPSHQSRLAALFHTGGTTGQPKLAQHTHGNQLFSAWGASRMFGMTPQDVTVNGFPVFHVAGTVVYGLSTLMSGAHMVLPTMLGMRNQSFMAGYWEFVSRFGITLLTGVPTTLSMLMQSAPHVSPGVRARAMLAGGAPLPDELAKSFERKFGVPVRNILGMTECAGIISIEPVWEERAPGSCGRPLPGTQVWAEDPEGRVLPAGGLGVLCVRGPNVGPGYSDPRRDPGSFRNGCLVTGDLGHVDAQGRVHVSGRSKDVIVRSGHNIDPRQIEEALLRHPAVAMAAAVGEPDEHAGELPVAFVVARQGASIGAQELLDFSRQHIPERPAWPRRIDFLDSLPLTAIGKVFKPDLRRMAITRCLRERLGQGGLDTQLAVDVRDESSIPVAGFTRIGEQDHEALAAALGELMKPFALRWRLEAADMPGSTQPSVPLPDLVARPQ